MCLEAARTNQKTEYVHIPLTLNQCSPLLCIYLCANTTALPNFGNSIFYLKLIRVWNHLQRIRGETSKRFTNLFYLSHFFLALSLSLYYFFSLSRYFYPALAFLLILSLTLDLPFLQFFTSFFHCMFFSPFYYCSFFLSFFLA